MDTNPEERIQEIEQRLQELPRGTLTYKKINGKEQPYLQSTINGKSVSYYIKCKDRDQILLELEERKELQQERRYLLSYMEKIKDILKKNPYMKDRVGIGYERFDEIRERGMFYVDKTNFIREWWYSPAQVSLITRPRRFGKTLMMSTVECFFSPLLAGHAEWFEKLAVWKDPELRTLYGKVPVIFLSFGSAKGGEFSNALHAIFGEIYECYMRYHFLAEQKDIPEEKRQKFKQIMSILCNEKSNLKENLLTVSSAVKWLCDILESYYGRKPYILLDEYDTPIIESYVNGYFNEMISFCRQFFQESFKSNPHFSRAIITGVARISKNSIFSDMNNIAVYTVTGKAFSTSFGFTEQEVMDALKCHDIDEMAKVKEMYDGFIFGDTRDIYNPWSISCFMVERNLESYWINTSSNNLIGELIRKNQVPLKRKIKALLQGQILHMKINENAASQYHGEDEESFWALLLSTGYIKADKVRKEMEYTDCDISITNKETMSMFENQILRMFPLGRPVCTEFAEALLKHQNEELNIILNDLLFTSVSYFDTGKRPSEKAPENFYHGLVLGLVVLLKDRYHISSNRESGYGRYDIALIPYNKEEDDAFIIEFKVRDEKREASLDETCDKAVEQIHRLHYEAELLAEKIPENHIYLLGFGFEGKGSMVKEERLLL